MFYYNCDDNDINATLFFKKHKKKKTMYNTEFSKIWHMHLAATEVGEFPDLS